MVLPALDSGLATEIEAATSIGEMAQVVSAHPDAVDAWAALGRSYEEAAETPENRVAAYAAFRVGYHRGLDALRANGWQGSGLVKWGDVSNRGFLRCVMGLGRMAGLIGETDEQVRCAEFLAQLDPDLPSI